MRVKGNVLQIHSKVKGIFFHLCASFRKCGSRKAVSFFRLEGPPLDALVMVFSIMIGLILQWIYFFQINVLTCSFPLLIKRGTAYVVL